MKSQKLKNIEGIIKDRKKRKHVYLDNRIIMNGKSNLDAITINFDAFFARYEYNNKQV